MDARLLDLLRSAQSIDLYELSVTISHMLDDPQRNFEVRRHLQIGAQVQYFSYKRAEMCTGKVIEMRPKQVVVEDAITQLQWLMPYTAVVVSAEQKSASAAAQAAAKPTPREIPHFEIGDTVAFTDKHFREHIGKVTRINPKTISVQCEDMGWRISPGFLRKIIDL